MAVKPMMMVTSVTAFATTRRILGRLVTIQKGDISNVVSPRLLVVFENLVGLHPTPADRAKYDAYKRVHRWKASVNTFVPNELFAKHLWDITWRHGYTVDCVTWLPEQMVEHVEKWIDREGLPFSRTWRFDPTELARRIATMPDIAAIYDPDPSHRFLFGSKGRIMTPDKPDIMGAF